MGVTDRQTQAVRHGIDKDHALAKLRVVKDFLFGIMLERNISNAGHICCCLLAELTLLFYMKFNFNRQII